MVQVIPRLLLAVWFGILYFYEQRQPLRRVRYNKIAHLNLNFKYFLINIILNGFIALFFLKSIEKIPSLLNFPSHFLKPFVLLFFLDLVIYYWHRLNHEVDFLWRFHKFHHSDREMDVSTALRFHMGEFALSAVFKSLIILIFGVTLSEYIAFELLVTGAAFFHHSNINLGKKLDHKLQSFIVTPMYHHIHHSDVHDVMNTNYGTIFSFWDKLHGTRTQMLPESITIGIKEFPETPNFKEGLKSCL